MNIGKNHKEPATIFTREVKEGNPWISGGSIKGNKLISKEILEQINLVNRL